MNRHDPVLDTCVVLPDNFPRERGASAARRTGGPGSSAPAAGARRNRGAFSFVPEQPDGAAGGVRGRKEHSTTLADGFAAARA
jgi:hypothetical protein